MPRIFDCFLFNAELDLLEFRLDLLAGVVDRHVLVEAPLTYSGAPKPLHYAENRERYSQHADRIIHVVVHDLPMPDPSQNGRWLPENFQRRSIERGLSEARPDDIALVCDVDELPDPARLAEVLPEIRRPVSLQMTLAYLRANWISRGGWPLARAAPIGAISDFQALRMMEPALVVQSAGCHMSYLMGEQQILDKLRTYAHDEFDTPVFTATAFLRLCMGAALFPLTAEPLVQRSPAELDPVQSALFKTRPDFFDFATLPPDRARRVISSYVRRRSSPKLPTLARRGIDATLASVLGRRA